MAKPVARPGATLLLLVGIGALAKCGGPAQDDRRRQLAWTAAALPRGPHELLTSSHTATTVTTATATSPIDAAAGVSATARRALSGSARRPPPASAQPSEALCTYNSLWLPKLVVPAHYDLFLNVSFNPNPPDEEPLSPPPTKPSPKFVYSAANLTKGLGPEAVVGNVSIHVALGAPTRCIVLHAAGMRLAGARYEYGGAAWPGAVEKAGGPGAKDYLMVVIRFRSALPATAVGSVGRLSLSFAYHLVDGVDGLYRSVYTDKSGRAHAVASTQLESIAARKAFPCFDEPALKATFNYTLVTPAGLTVLGNTDKLASRPLPGSRLLTAFRPTPKMSPYLVAWVVGRLASANTTCEVSPPGAPLPLAMYATPDQ
ncbi:hypothetical protein GPECTOR_958g222 [Gonium pectorale]|uniref:Aminopeptidase N-like N-terminal domain-containing protein n=1 Tax=Gonium pectorale TaxID=33097 RepID=A0A150FTS8_GONPE|nr:hypothetical protein GPECTOR_958g222 [Gonium pectorale]|eukprot:KXZ41027.1 hypothetical protein GPECTOR_958g222 [Gonium pectorale]